VGLADADDDDDDEGDCRWSSRSETLLSSRARLHGREDDSKAATS
jgi:hypothetical protein